MEPVRRMAQLTIHLPNVVFVTAPTLRSGCANFSIESKNKSASPTKRRPINPNPREKLWQLKMKSNTSAN
jgi:hypothetical protein